MKFHKKLRFFLIPAMAICINAISLTTAQGTDSTNTITFHPISSANMPSGRRLLVVTYTAKPPKIDGLGSGDACWSHIAWTSFVSADGQGKIKNKTNFKACYDAQHLYLLFYAFKRHEHSAKDVAWAIGHDQTGMFQHDNIQIFLEPNGSDAQVYQIALNPAGGVYDLTHKGASSNLHWNAKNLRVAGHIGQGYFLEVAIPFSDLRITKPVVGQSWRVDFCRKNHAANELSCWAPTGPAFYAPSRFGTMIFSLPKHSQQQDNSHCTVHGNLVQPDGKPASYVMVRTTGGRTRTDAHGQFTLKHVPSGKQIIGFSSPAYCPLVGQINVKKVTQTLAPIELTPVDPYQAHFAGPIGQGWAAWLKSDIGHPFDMTSRQRPTHHNIAQQLSLLAAPGQYQSRAVALYINKNIPKPTISVHWSGSGKSKLDSSANIKLDSKVRWVSRNLDRYYLSPRETSVFQWKYVWNHPPAKLKKGRVRMIILTVHVPKMAHAGNYGGMLILCSSGRAVATLPLKLAITDFHLDSPKKQLGLYYFFQFDKWTDMELKDIRAHGGSILITSAASPSIHKKNGKSVVDLSRLRKVIKLLQDHNFPPPYPVRIPAFSASQAGFQSKTRAIISSLKQLHKNMNTAPFILWWMDEVFADHRLPRWLAIAKAVRPLTNAKTFITIDIKHPKKMTQADPYLDIRGYNGRSIEAWLATGHHWSELNKKLKISGDIAWTYYNDVGLKFTPEDERLTSGYWLWRSPFQASVPWVYRDPRRNNDNLLNTMDNTHGDLGFSFHDPHHHELVSTLDWEAYRQGYNDLCYLATLKQAIKKAPPSNNAAKKAEKWLKNLHSKLPQTVSAIAAALTAKDYRQRRIKMTKMIEAIKSSANNQDAP